MCKAYKKNNKKTAVIRHYHCRWLSAALRADENDLQFSVLFSRAGLFTKFTFFLFFDRTIDT